MLTQEQFKIIFPKNKAPESWLSHFSLLGSFGISTKEQIAAFCSQIGHESLDLTILEENLNYSAESLLRVFPKYFDPLTATALARKPEDIANVVYANRMGNGNTSSGEGWKYRGRGIIQLTGKQNYSRCSKYIFDDENVLLNDPDLVADDHRVAMQ
jgi:putative chitinase